MVNHMTFFFLYIVSCLAQNEHEIRNTSMCYYYYYTQCGPEVPGLNFLPLSYRRHIPGRE